MPPGAGFSIPLGEAVVNITAALDGLDDDLKRARSKTAKAVKQIGQSAARVGAALTKAITLPILAIGAASVRASVKFDASMRKITALVGISTKQVNAWRKEVLAMSAAVGRGPQELAEGLFFVASAGARGQEALDILKVSAQAAAAGLGDTKTVADAVTSAVNAYGAANLSAADATGILVATVREGKAEASELSGVFGRVLPVAAQLGVRFDEIGAALAAMTRLGASADESATALRAVLAGLLKPSIGAEKAMAEYGLSAERLRRQLREEGLLATLNTLTETVGDNDAAMAQIFPNIRALVGVFNLMGKNAETAERIFKALASGGVKDLRDAIEETAKGPGFQMQQALSSINVLMIELGDSVLPSLIPIVKSVTETVRDLAVGWGELSREQKESRLRWVGIAAVVGPALLVLGKAVTVVSSLRIAWTAAGLSMGAVALTGGPVLLLAAALATLTFAIVEATEALDEWNTAVEKANNLQPLEFAKGGRKSASELLMKNLLEQLDEIPKEAKDARRAMQDLVLDAEVLRQENRFAGKGLGLFGIEIEEFEARAAEVREMTRSELAEIGAIKLDAAERSAVDVAAVEARIAAEGRAARLRQEGLAGGNVSGIGFSLGDSPVIRQATIEQAILDQNREDRALAEKEAKKRHLEDLRAATDALALALQEREELQRQSRERQEAERARTTRTLFGAGFAEQIQTMHDGIAQLGIIGARVAQNLVQGLGGALSGFVLGTKSAGEAFKDFARVFLAQMVGMIAQAAILALLTSIFSFGASAETGQAAFAAVLFGPSGNAAKGVPGAATGGSFTIPGAKSGVDASLMMLRVTPGEEVSVRNRSAAQAGGDRGPGGGTELIVVEGPPGQTPQVEESQVEGLRQRVVRFVSEDVENGGEIDQANQRVYRLRRAGRV